MIINSSGSLAAKGTKCVQMGELGPNLLENSQFSLNLQQQKMLSKLVNIY